MTITVTRLSGEPPVPWNPEIGSRTLRFVEARTTGKKAIPGPAMNTVLEEAKDILTHCVPPSAPNGAAAVLVVGYVQSGKTLSFTTLASLARDNGYGVVILLAGTTNNLKDQSQDRLEKDLGLDELQRDWTPIYDNPDIGGSAFPQMKSAVRNWRRRQQGLTQEDKPTLVVSILKNAGRIQSAAEALSKLDLTEVPVLIIDDESDQATPNTRARRNRQTGANDTSATYEAVLKLRDALPHHSLVQYTATPQANLLLATTDLLNPDYCKVLSSGPGYTGGQLFFQDRIRDLVRVVPDRESFDPRRPLTEPPEKLQEALRVFLLGIADANIKRVEENRSMMVQAHQNTAPHQTYWRWIQALLDDWQRGLTAGGEYAAEVTEEFEAAYAELAKTVVDLAPFDQLMANVPERAAELRVVEVNSTAQAEKRIKWKTAYYWILIGGMKLDRGFTVEGLTITYMPRAIAGNADVLQQRARFFGYREDYINYCRVYILRSAKEAFAGYVADEEFLRDSLRSHEGKPLSDWKRDFILHRQFAHPTRTSVVGRRTTRRRTRGEWSWPRSMHIGSKIRAGNANIFRNALEASAGKTFDASELPGVVDKRSTSKRNLVRSGVPLGEALEFLMKVRLASRDDSLLLSAITMELARLQREGADTTAAYVFMGGLDVPDGRGRQLTVVQQTLHVGMNPTGATGDQVRYSGDDTMHSASEVTLQLRTIRLTDPPPDGEDYSTVPWLAIRLPDGLSQDSVLDLD